ncbi:interleukin-12 subunit beta-like [Pelodytes ibericus]
MVKAWSAQVTRHNIPEMFVQHFQFMHLILVLSLCACVQSALDSWPKTYVVVPDSEPYTLHCDFNTQTVKWKVPSEDCLSQSLQDQTLELDDLSQPCAGRYTCLTADDQPLKSIHLLINEDENEHVNLSCSVDSYTSPVLHCSVPISFTTDCLIRAKADISSSSEDADWLYMKWKMGANKTFRFNLSISQLCPFEEQMSPIVVMMEAMTESQYMAGTRQYYIRDIMRPRPPEQVKVIGPSVSWKYPSSWARPSSYFPLLFEVNLKYIDNNEISELVSGLHRNLSNVKCVRVRCRDLYSNSMWSTWASPSDRSSRCVDSHSSFSA